MQRLVLSIIAPAASREGDFSIRVARLPATSPLTRAAAPLAIALARIAERPKVTFDAASRGSEHNNG